MTGRARAIGRAARAALVLAAGAAAGCGGGTSPAPGGGADGRAAGSTPGPVAGSAAGRWFTDVSDAAGIDFVHDNGATGRKYMPEIMGSGGCALDYDGDGRMDVLLVQSGAVPGADYGPASRPTGPGRRGTRLYRNRGDGTFEDATEKARVRADGYGMGAVSADYDNDGFPDVYVVAFGPNTLLRNRGDGTFEDVSAKARVAGGAFGSSACFFDADDDGRLDLYVANYVEFAVATHKDCGDPARGRFSYCHPSVYPPAPDVFYRNLGDGTFEDATERFGFTDTTGKGLGVMSSDFDGDGRPDVFVANDSTPNFLYRNLGGGRFEEVGVPLGVAFNEDGRTQAGMGVATADVDGDGRLDIFVTNLTQQSNGLYLGGARDFTYASRSAGLYVPSFLWVGFGTDLVDLDDDGAPDLFVANGHVLDDAEAVLDAVPFRQPCQVFRNDGKGRFAEIDRAAAGDVSIPRVGRGTITLDYDDDGGQDMLVCFNNDRARLFRNVRTPRGHWIKFDLRGTTRTRDAIGARVTVERADGRRGFEEKRAGSSYECSNDPRLHFGLGADAVATRVTVRWPGGATQSVDRLAADRVYRWTEGSAPVPR